MDRTSRAPRSGPRDHRLSLTGASAAPPRPLRALRHRFGPGHAGVRSRVPVRVPGAGQGPRVATGAAFLAGAVVNFTANRYWAWNLRARRGLGRHALLYAALSLTAALAAAVVTSATHAALRDADPDRRALLVEASYLATYALLFVVKF